MASVPQEFEAALETFTRKLLNRATAAGSRSKYSTAYVREAGADVAHLGRVSRKTIYGTKHLFVSVANGDIFGAASASKPQKAAVGNIYSDDALAAFDESGWLKNADERAGKAPAELAPSEISEDVNAFLIDPKERTVTGMHLHARMSEARADIANLLVVPAEASLTMNSVAPCPDEALRSHLIYSLKTDYQSKAAGWRFGNVSSIFRSKSVLVIEKFDEVRVGRRKVGVTNLPPIPMTPEDFAAKVVVWTDEGEAF